MQAVVVREEDEEEHTTCSLTIERVLSPYNMFP